MQRCQFLGFFPLLRLVFDSFKSDSRKHPVYPVKQFHFPMRSSTSMSNFLFIKLQFYVLVLNCHLKHETRNLKLPFLNSGPCLPICTNLKIINSITYSYVVGLMFILKGSLPDSNLFAIVTLFPNMQYRGILTPTTPARTEPVWIPILICNESKTH